MKKAVIDFHSHFLPEMDDGSRSIQMSCEMLQTCQKQAVDIVCATPHFYNDRESISHFIARRDRQFDRLKEAAAFECEVYLGAEIACTSDLFQLPDLGRLALSGTKTLLIEMPYALWQPHQIDAFTAFVLKREYQVILAHPERFCMYEGNERFLRKMAHLPAGFQVNADSIVHLRTRKQALDLLAMSRYPLLGSDAHNVSNRKMQLKKARNIIARKLGKAFLEEIDHNGLRFLEREMESII